MNTWSSSPQSWWNHLDLRSVFALHPIIATLTSFLTQQVGYNYVNIDDCYSEKERDKSGNIVASAHHLAQNAHTFYILSIMILQTRNVFRLEWTNLRTKYTAWDCACCQFSYTHLILILLQQGRHRECRVAYWFHKWTDRTIPHIVQRFRLVYVCWIPWVVSKWS